MEYALMALLLIFQELWNTLLNLMVVDSVPLGGVLIAVMILGVFLHQFKMENNSSSGGSGFKSNDKGDKTS